MTVKKLKCACILHFSQYSVIVLNMGRAKPMNAPVSRHVPTFHISLAAGHYFLQEECTQSHVCPTVVQFVGGKKYFPTSSSQVLVEFSDPLHHLI
jgi:hypothetical protein